MKKYLYRIIYVTLAIMLIFSIFQIVYLKMTNIDMTEMRFFITYWRQTFAPMIPVVLFYAVTLKGK